MTSEASNNSQGVFPKDLTPLDNEKIIGHARISNGIYWQAIAVFIFAVVIGFFASPLGLFLFLVSGLIFAWNYAVKHFLFLIVTNKRLLLRQGVIRLDTVQIPLERIESVEIERNPMGAVLDYGTIVVTGTGSRFAAIPYIDQPAKLRNIIEQILQKNRETRDQIDRADPV